MKFWSQDELDLLRDVVEEGASRDTLLAAFPDRNYNQIEKAWSRYFGGSLSSRLRSAREAKAQDLSVDDVTDYDKILSEIGKRRDPYTLMELCDLFQASPSATKAIIEDAAQRGIHLNVSSDGFVLKNLAGERNARSIEIKPIAGRIVFGVVSDTHSGSIHSRPNELSDFVHFAHNEYGVERILHVGDFVAGQGIYPGQEGELAAWGMEAQLLQACEDLPEIRGLHYELIGGNHDYSFTRRNGGDPLLAITRLRKDIHSHGWFNAMLSLSGIKVELLHPDAGGAYAMSYYLQKHIESTPGGIKPQIMVVGHYHQAIWLPGYRNVHGFYAGCFEGQSLYLKRKKLYPIIGGWIFEVGVDEDGSIREFLPRFVSYFEGKRKIGAFGGGD